VFAPSTHHSDAQRELAVELHFAFTGKLFFTGKNEQVFSAKI
jgi:hypothetical protein